MTMASTAAVMSSCGIAMDSGVDAGNSTDGTARHEHNANSHFIVGKPMPTTRMDINLPLPPNTIFLKQMCHCLHSLSLSRTLLLLRALLWDIKLEIILNKKNGYFLPLSMKRRKTAIQQCGSLHCSPKSQCCTNKEECPVKYVYGFNKKKSYKSAGLLDNVDTD
jgi:hypothetical protein